MSSRNYGAMMGLILKNPRIIFLTVIGTIIYLLITLFDGTISINVESINSIPLETALKSMVSLICLSILNSFVLINVVNIIRNLSIDQNLSDHLKLFQSFIPILVLTFIFTTLLAITGVFPILFSIYIYNYLSMVLSVSFVLLIIFMILMGIFLMFVPISIIFSDLSITESLKQFIPITKKISLKFFILGTLPLATIYSMVYIIPIISYLFTYPVLVLSMIILTVIYSNTLTNVDIRGNNSPKNLKIQNSPDSILIHCDDSYYQCIDENIIEDGFKNMDFKPDDVKLYFYHIKKPYKVFKRIVVNGDYPIEEDLSKLKKKAFELGANAVVEVKYHKKFLNLMTPKFSGLAVYVEDPENVKKSPPPTNSSMIINGFVVIFLLFAGIHSNLLILPVAVFMVVYGFYQRFGFSSTIFRLVIFALIIANTWCIYSQSYPANLSNPHIYSLAIYAINILIVILLSVYLYNTEITNDKLENYNTDMW